MFYRRLRRPLNEQAPHRSATRVVLATLKPTLVPGYNSRQHLAHAAAFRLETRRCSSAPLRGIPPHAEVRLARAARAVGCPAPVPTVVRSYYLAGGDHTEVGPLGPFKTRGEALAYADRVIGKETSMTAPHLVDRLMARFDGRRRECAHARRDRGARRGDTPHL